jgi:hypothetical protein
MKFVKSHENVEMKELMNHCSWKMALLKHEIFIDGIFFQKNSKKS